MYNICTQFQSFMHRGWIETWPLLCRIRLWILFPNKILMSFLPSSRKTVTHLQSVIDKQDPLVGEVRTDGFYCSVIIITIIIRIFIIAPHQVITAPYLLLSLLPHSTPSSRTERTPVGCFSVSTPPCSVHRLAAFRKLTLIHISLSHTQSSQVLHKAAAATMRYGVKFVCHVFNPPWWAPLFPDPYYRPVMNETSSNLWDLSTGMWQQTGFSCSSLLLLSLGSASMDALLILAVI